MQNQERNQRRDVSLIFPGRALYSQFAAISGRYDVKNLPIGTEVHYHQVLFDQSPEDQREQLKGALAQLIYNDLEAPSFTPQSPSMPYTPDVFVALFGIPDATTLLAWRKPQDHEEPRLPFARFAVDCDIAWSGAR